MYKADKAKDGILGDDYIGYNSESADRIPYEMYVCSMDVGETNKDNHSTACFDILMEYPISKDDIAKGVQIDIEKMGFEKYADIFLPDHQWDCEALNQEINDKLKGIDSGYEVVKTIDEKGCQVEFTVYPDEIMFKLYSPIYIVE